MKITSFVFLAFIASLFTVFGQPYRPTAYTTNTAAAADAHVRGIVVSNAQSANYATSAASAAVAGAAGLATNLVPPIANLIYTNIGNLSIGTNISTHANFTLNNATGDKTTSGSETAAGGFIGGASTATNALGFTSLGTTNIFEFGNYAAPQGEFLDTTAGSRDAHNLNNWGSLWRMTGTQSSQSGNFYSGIDDTGNNFNNEGFVYGVYPLYGDWYFNGYTTATVFPTNIISFKWNLYTANPENILRMYGAQYFEAPASLRPNDASYPNGYTVSTLIPFVGGSASAMDDLPPSPTAVANNMPLPIFRFMADAGNTAQMTNWVQSEITNTLPRISTVHNFLTNNGVTTVAFVDGYWQAAHRDSGGGIVWDTNQFPSGMPWLANWLHTNGWNFELADYYLGGYSNEVSSIIFGGSANYVMLTPNTIQRDIARIHSWGVDGFRAEDSELGSGYQQQMVLQLSAACVAPGGSVFNDIVNQPYPHPMYSSVLLQNPPNMNWSSWVNTVGNDGISYFQPASQTVQFQIDMWNFRVDWTNYVPGTSRGHYVDVSTFSGGGWDPPVGDAHIVLSSAAMMFSSLNFWGATNDSIAASFSNSVLSNTNWISVWHDPLFAHAQKVYDGGLLTTSVWSRALSTGGAAVLMVNETNTQPMSVQFGALGMSPALTTFDVFDCWSNQDLGNFTGGFTNSIGFQDCGLYVVTPVSSISASSLNNSAGNPASLTNAANSFSGTFTGNGSGLTGVKVADTNITGTITVTNGNVGIGTTTPLSKLEVADSQRWSLSEDPNNYYLNLVRDITSGNVRWSFDQKNAGFDYGRVLTFTTGKIGIGGELNPASNISVSGNLSVGDSTYTTTAAPTGGAIIQGNVGIGTNAPDSLLHVAGNGHFNGTVTASGFASTITVMPSITNWVDMSSQVQLITETTTNITLLGFSNLVASVVNTCILEVTNSTATAAAVTLSPAFHIGVNSTNCLWIPAGKEGRIFLDYIDQTNAMTTLFQ